MRKDNIGYNLGFVCFGLAVVFFVLSIFSFGTSLHDKLIIATEGMLCSGLVTTGLNLLADKIDAKT